MKTHKELEIHYRYQIGKPIGATEFICGRSVLWIPDGYLDQVEACLYGIEKTKAIIWDYNTLKIRRVPITHIHPYPKEMK